MLVYPLEKILNNMHHQYYEYSEFFENDLPLNMISTRYCIKDNKVITTKNTLDNSIYNQNQRMNIYNYIFYKMFISKKNENNYKEKLKCINRLLDNLYMFDVIFVCLGICNFERSIQNKKVNRIDKMFSFYSIINLKQNKHINFKLFGYSIKDNFEIRIFALEKVIEFYGIIHVMQTLKKIKSFNKSYNEDYNYLITKFHLFPNVLYTSIDAELVNEDSTIEIQEGTKPINYKSVLNTGIFNKETLYNSCCVGIPVSFINKEQEHFEQKNAKYLSNYYNTIDDAFNTETKFNELMTHLSQQIII